MPTACRALKNFLQGPEFRVFYFLQPRTKRTNRDRGYCASEVELMQGASVGAQKNKNPRSFGVS
jgi:hypothetical protein